MFSRVCNTILRASCSLVPSRQLSSSARDGLTKILAKRGTQSPRWPYNFSNSNVRIVNEFTELRESFRPFSSSVGVSKPQQTEQKLLRYFETEIAWPIAPNSKLSFRSTTKAIDGYTDAQDINKYIFSPTEKLDAPFFNRKEILKRLLTANLYNVQLQRKPLYSLQAMGRGQGKTRLLVEWMAQAFAKVLADPESAREIHQNDTMTKKFLNLLYYSHYRQYTILCSGITIDNTVPRQESVQVLIRSAILKLHHNQTVQFANKSITIDAEAPKNWFGLDTEEVVPPVQTLLDLFITLCNLKFEAPPVLPYPEEGLPDMAKGFVFFSIDESQLYSIKAVQSPDLVYQLLSAAADCHTGCKSAGIYPFWYATGTWTPGAMIDLTAQHSRFELIDATLDNLLDLKFLAKLCNQFFQANLHKTFIEVEDADLPELPREVSLCLVRNFLHTFGIPRAIETFVKVTRPLVAKLVNDFNILGPLEFGKKSLLKCSLAMIDQVMSEQLSTLFTVIDFDIGEDRFEQLNLKAALCSKLPPDEDMFPNIPSTPKLLVAGGILSLWHRTQNAFYYTRPFFNFTSDQLNAPLKCLKGSARDNSFWFPVHPTLASLIVEQKFAGFLHLDSQNKGAAFETALASTLYARYQVRLMKGVPVTFADLWAIPPTNSTSELLDALLKSNVVLNGVVKLRKQQKTFKQDVYELLAKMKYIAIDVGNSSSANVLVPVTVRNRVIIVGFQCKQHQRAPPQDAYVTNAKKFFKLPRCQVWFGAAPQNSNSKKLMQLNTATNVALTVEPDMLVSPLYQVGMSIVPAAFNFDFDQ